MNRRDQLIKAQVERTRDVIRRQHKSIATEMCYCGWLRRYFRFVFTVPRELTSEQKMERFLTMLAFLKKHCAAALPSVHITSGGQENCKQVILWLHKAQTQLDLWFAMPETLATRLLCRTGSMQHNIWLASRAKAQGKKWNPYEGILVGGRWTSPSPPQGGGEGRGEVADEYIGGNLIRFRSESEIYEALGLPFIAPANREQPWLVKHFVE